VLCNTNRHFFTKLDSQLTFLQRKSSELISEGIADLTYKSGCPGYPEYPGGGNLEMKGNWKKAINLKIRDSKKFWGWSCV
jgi:hypothetical protein